LRAKLLAIREEVQSSQVWLEALRNSLEKFYEFLEGL
jgi:hypothetical protein